MKKSISTLFLIFVSLITTAQSEKGFYARVNSGYNIGTGNVNYIQVLVTGIANVNETSASTNTTELIKINLGKGFNVGANLGYMFNKNIGFELGGNYLFGEKIKSSSTSYTGNYKNGEISAKMIQIKPTLMIGSGFAKINPYAKVGMVVGSGKITVIQNQKDGADIYNRTLELDGGTPIGFHASLGTLYKLNDKLSLFGELNLVSLEYAPKKGKYTEATVNGIDELPTMITNDIEIDFIDNFNNTGAPINPNEPAKIAKTPFSFSSFGLNVGLQYHF